MKEGWDLRRDGPLTEEGLRKKIESLGYSVERYVYPPGTVFPAHAHDVDKIDAVVSGRFRLVIDGESVMLMPGEWIEVPRGTVHSAEVVGNDSVVSLDSVRFE